MQLHTAPSATLRNRARQATHWNFAKHLPLSATSFVYMLALIGATVVAAVFAGTNQVQAQSPVTYYVDCSAGTDTNTGTSTAQAWKSINKANAAPLQPGDKLLLKRGCAWTGPLKAKWIGTASQPITIGAYGTGSLPRIQNAYSSNVQITGSYQIIEYLETTLTTPPSPDANCKNQPVAWKLGFSFGANAAYNTLQYSKATKLAIGVFLDYKAHHNKVLYNTLTDNNVVWQMDARQSLGAMGILLHGDYNEIAYNYFANNKTLCTYTGVVESNSIELYGARYSNIHHNQSFGDRVFSELGSNSTYPSTDNTFAYNLHVVGPMNSSTGSRFVVTRGQGHAYGPVWRTKIYNNTLYHTGTDSKGVTCQYCTTDVLTVKNNIFWVNREGVSSDGAFGEEGNIYWATAGNPIVNFTKHASSQLVNPAFVDAAANNFRLQQTSLARDMGSLESVSAGYAKDMDQVDVPQALKVDAGIYELAVAVPASPTSTPTPTPTDADTAQPGVPTPTATPSPSPTPEPTAAPLLACTISINDGALYTGADVVRVRVNVPTATQMMVSNDAGFNGTSWQPYQSQFDWTLRDTGGNIATMLLYARFADSSGDLPCGGTQLSDDIIVDPVPPTVNATLVTPTGEAVAAGAQGLAVTAETTRLATVTVNLAAADQENGSGVERMQFSPDGNFSDPTWQPFSAVVTLNGEVGQTLYVRVQDATGNVSSPTTIVIPGSMSVMPNLYIPMIQQ